MDEEGVGWSVRGEGVGRAWTRACVADREAEGRIGVADRLSGEAAEVGTAMGMTRRVCGCLGQALGRRPYTRRRITVAQGKEEHYSVE